MLVPGVQLNGNVPGDKVVGVRGREGRSGLLAHSITTGVQQLYEGVTIASVVDPKQSTMPLVLGSDATTVVAVVRHLP